MIDNWGPYQLLEKIGEGGMGVVYRAWDPKLRRTVAIKMLSGVVDQRRCRRFLREARVASAVPHPGIVTVYDYLSDQQRHGIVMEFVPGTSLRQTMDERWSWQTVSRHALALAEALRAAHAAGIIHCDLKPENVMITPDGTLKVLDFGIATLNGQRDLAEGLKTLTRDQAGGAPLPGTLLYMSPEQTLGEALDERSDIFSFGILLYEMLVGERPFQGSNTIAYLNQLHYADRTFCRLQQLDLPESLRELVIECLEQRRDLRPQRMESVIERLQERVPAPASLGRKRMQPGSLLGTVIGWRCLRARFLVLGMLVLASPTLIWPQVRSRLDRLQAAHTTSLQQHRMFDLYRQAWEDLSRFERPGRLERAIEAFERIVASGEMQAAAYAGLARAYWRRYRWQSHDRHWLDRATWVARRAVELDGHLAQARISLALVELENNRLGSAREQLDEALRLDPGNEDAFFVAARVHLTAGDFESAQQAFEASQGAGKNDRELYDLWGRLHYEQGDFVAAMASFETSIDLAPDSTSGYRNLAAVYFKLDRYSQAAEVLQRALTLEPSTDLYTNLGTLYFYQGLYAESAAVQEKAFEFSGTANHYLNWGNYADALRQIPGREREARDAYQQALQLLERKLAEVGLTATEQSRRALYLARQGSPMRALTELEALDEKAWKTPAVLYRAALVQELAGHRETALASLAKAMEAGYAEAEIRREPDLLPLRDDRRYPRMLDRLDLQGL